MSGIISAFKGEGDRYAGGIYSAIREAAKYIGSGPGEGSDKINLGKPEENKFKYLRAVSRFKYLYSIFFTLNSSFILSQISFTSNSPHE